jgi:hypothetical protein
MTADLGKLLLSCGALLLVLGALFLLLGRTGLPMGRLPRVQKRCTDWSAGAVFFGASFKDKRTPY